MLQRVSRAPGSAAVCLRKLRGVVELPELGHFAIAEREDVYPVAGHGAAGLADFPGIMAEHADAVASTEEFSRREVRCFLVLRNALEELFHFARPLPTAE